MDDINREPSDLVLLEKYNESIENMEWEEKVKFLKMYDSQKMTKLELYMFLSFFFSFAFLNKKLKLNGVLKTLSIVWFVCLFIGTVIFLFTLLFGILVPSFLITVIKGGAYIKLVNNLGLLIVIFVVISYILIIIDIDDIYEQSDLDIKKNIFKKLEIEVK